MKANGRMTEDMVRDLRDTVMPTSMKVISVEVKLMVVEYTNGKMVKYMKENGLMVKKMGKEHGKVRFIVFINFR